MALNPLRLSPPRFQCPQSSTSTACWRFFLRPHPKPDLSPTSADKNPKNRSGLRPPAPWRCSCCRRRSARPAPPCSSLLPALRREALPLLPGAPASRSRSRPTCVSSSPAAASGAPGTPTTSSTTTTRRKTTGLRKRRTTRTM
jgi:hypothetical protein